VGAAAEELAATLPKGWRSAPADEELIRSMKADMPPETNVRITGRAVGRDEPAAAVVVFELDKPSDTDEFMAGVAEEAGDDRVEEVAWLARRTAGAR
jgi:hypothetical protein